ncbi:MAG: hypothetical protein ACD_43C00165G0001, partial [uncultured bacterium]
ESGIATAADFQQVRALGYQAALIGTALMSSPAPAQLIKDFYTYGI